MPRKVKPASEFGKRLYHLRTQRRLTQMELADSISSTQRAISHYETVAEYPPAPVLIELSKALKVSTDELLGLKKPKIKQETPETRRLWRRFQLLLTLPERDRRAIIRMINSLVATKKKDSTVRQTAKGIEARQ
jgi:transcriptional regulator with XRE-family HTH domain